MVEFGGSGGSKRVRRGRSNKKKTVTGGGRRKQKKDSPCVSLCGEVGGGSRLGGRGVPRLLRCRTYSYGGHVPHSIEAPGGVAVRTATRLGTLELQVRSMPIRSIRTRHLCTVHPATGSRTYLDGTSVWRPVNIYLLGIYLQGEVLHTGACRVLMVCGPRCPRSPRQGLPLDSGCGSPPSSRTTWRPVRRKGRMARTPTRCMSFGRLLHIHASSALQNACSF